MNYYKVRNKFTFTSFLLIYWAYNKIKGCLEHFYPLILFRKEVLSMSFTDFYDIYRICSDCYEDEQSGGMVKLGNDLTSSPLVNDLPLPSSNRWWELAEKEIQSEKRENASILVHS